MPASLPLGLRVGPVLTCHLAERSRPETGGESGERFVGGTTMRRVIGRGSGVVVWCCCRRPRGHGCAVWKALYLVSARGAHTRCSALVPVVARMALIDSRVDSYRAC
jgi:hypothetical protein